MQAKVETCDAVNLVYQCGIANVFTIALPETDEDMRGCRYRRVMQGDYRACEYYAAGIALGLGLQVQVWHCDEAGDILVGREWQAGAGDMFGDSKCPINAVGS